MKREEIRERNHDKNAIAAESRYLLQSFAEQYDTPALSKISATLAVEQAAPKERNDRTYDRANVKCFSFNLYQEEKEQKRHILFPRRYFPYPISGDDD